ncbi:MAG: hypothetical protein ABI678_22545 [Kofleriaceae bacterium]
MERRIRIAAATVAIIYLAIQAFQELVFRTLGEPATPAESLAIGGHPLHIARSVAMLAAMFGLVFLYGAVCLQRVRERPVLAGFTFLAFLLFGLLEIGLRSVELIWTQVELPTAYATTHDPAILDHVAMFEAVQHALYLPLGGAVLIGSVLAVWLFSTGRRIDRVVQAVFAFNALRNLTRLITVYVGVPLFPGDAYTAAYFPMVVVFYAPLAYWFVKRGR